MGFGEILKGVIGPILGPLLDRIPDPNERARAKEAVEGQMMSAMTGLVQAQIEVNKVEAQHTSIFVAGWRPAIGWICGLGLGMAGLIYPVLMWVAWFKGIDMTSAPEIDNGELTTILLGMLGLGGLRTYEKRLGVARSGIKAPATPPQK